jgi:hypothetical protein
MPEKLPTISIPAVEIFRSGTHNGDSYSVADLDDMVTNFSKVNLDPTVKSTKVGHQMGQEELDEKAFTEIFGAPALGYVERIYRKGELLLADIKEVPETFGKLVDAGAYRHISAEIYWNYKEGDAVYDRVLKSIAFLGAEIPAITSLKAIEALYQKNDLGSLSAYDDNDNEYRLYDYESQAEAEKDKKEYIHDTRLAKSNLAVDYRKVTSGTTDRCSNCRFFDGFELRCNLVEGTIERNWTCDLFESMPSLFSQAEVNTEETVMAELDKEIVVEEVEDKDTELKLNAQADEIAELQAKLVSAEAEKSEADVKLNSQAEENTELQNRVTKLETLSQDSQDKLREQSVEGWVDKTLAEGKLSPAEAPLIRSLMLWLPTDAVHKYSVEDNEVSETVSDTLKKIFENRASILGEMTEVVAESNDKIVTYSDAQEEMQVRGAKYQMANPEVSLFQAYKAVMKEDEDLATRYSNMS